jgi:hypothetical protein
VYWALSQLHRIVDLFLFIYLSNQQHEPPCQEFAAAMQAQSGAVRVCSAQMAFESQEGGATCAFQQSCSRSSCEASGIAASLVVSPLIVLCWIAGAKRQLCSAEEIIYVSGSSSACLRKG